jgi:predicted enzyme related to lactoylglutathione lyase
MHTKTNAVLSVFAAAAFSLCCGLRAQNPEPAAGTKASEVRTASEPGNPTLKRVTGIGGVFIKAKDPAKLRAWYKTHLGIDVQAWGGASFRWVDAAGAPVKGKTAWFIGNGSTFAPSESPFMINYRVADLQGLLKALRAEGCQVLDKVEQSDFGSFGWVMDPEGNKVELWQPPAGQ